MCMSCVCVCSVGIQPPHGGEGNNIRAEEEEDFILEDGVRSVWGEWTHCLL